MSTDTTLPIDFVQEALVYRGFNWSVFPIRSEKRPAVSWKPLQSRRPTDLQLGRLFRRPRVVTGLAVITGWVSNGLAVRDFDDRPSYRHWAFRNPRIAARCPTVATPRGAHVFCRLPRSTFARWRDGELRATTRQYVVLPPSKGRFDQPDRYWVDGEPGSADFPLLDLAETGFIDAEHPAEGHVRAKPTSAKTTHSSPADTQTTRRVTQDVLIHGETLPIGVREVVASCLPDGPGERAECLFQLVRSLKGLAHVADADAAELEPVVRFWHQLALPVIRTKKWDPTWREFQNGWRLVRHPAGLGPAADLMRQAAQGELPDSAAGSTDEPTRKLLAVCRALDSMGWQGNWFLSCRTAEAVCGFKSHMTAARRLRTFVDAGLLEVVEPGSGGTSRRIAASYRLRPEHAVILGRQGGSD